MKSGKNKKSPPEKEESNKIKLIRFSN